MQRDKKCKITGIGSALVDILINESDQFLADLGKEKGGMTLVEEDGIQKILTKSANRPVVVPGGAACNTIIGIACLGGEAGFIGKRGNDEFGEAFEKELKKCGVDPFVSLCDSPTGKVLSVITPDAQRSMFTFLGASTQLDPDSITVDMFNKCAIAVIEGYLLFNRDLMIASLKAAKAAGSLIALDLASFEVVNASKDMLHPIIDDYVDILIANEDEAKAFTNIDDELKAIEKMAENVTYAVLKVGSRGSYVSHENKVIHIQPVRGETAVDTTGAGDLWAAGFLFGLARGYSIELSGKIASACGYEICQVIGAHLPDDAWLRIKEIFADF